MTTVWVLVDIKLSFIIFTLYFIWFTCNNLQEWWYKARSRSKTKKLKEREWAKKEKKAMKWNKRWVITLIETVLLYLFVIASSWGYFFPFYTPSLTLYSFFCVSVQFYMLCTSCNKEVAVLIPMVFRDCGCRAHFQGCLLSRLLYPCITLSEMVTGDAKWKRNTKVEIKWKQAMKMGCYIWHCNYCKSVSFGGVDT